MMIDRIRQEKLILIDFYTSTCSICTVLDISLEEVKKGFGDQLDVVKINVDEDKINTIHFDATYQIMGVPTLMLFQNNQLIWNNYGILFPEDLKHKIKEYINEWKLYYNLGHGILADH